jgi:hypothetical protein
VAKGSGTGNMVENKQRRLSLSADLSPPRGVRKFGKRPFKAAPRRKYGTVFKPNLDSKDFGLDEHSQDEGAVTPELQVKAKTQKYGQTVQPKQAGKPYRPRLYTR